MVSSSSPAGRLSDSMSVTKPASYLRPSWAWISRFWSGAVRGPAPDERVGAGVSVMSVAMGAAYCPVSLNGSGVGQAHVDAPGGRGDFGGGVRWWHAVDHLGQGDLAQCVDHHVVDPAPVGAHAALVLDRAVAGVDAAFGHAERPFHGLDHLDEADGDRGSGQPVAAVGAAEP